MPRPVISRRQSAIHVVARPFDLLLWFDVLMNAHHLLSSRAGASTIPYTLCNPTVTVGTSAHGVRANRNHHHQYALQIAASDTASPVSRAGALVCPSWRPACRAGPISTHRIGGAFGLVGVDLVSLFPGSWPSGSDIAGGRVSSFCPAASCDPSSGTSLRLTIP